MEDLNPNINHNLDDNNARQTEENYSNNHNNNDNSESAALVCLSVCAQSVFVVTQLLKPHLPPCVLVVIYKTRFNGWATGRRMRGKAPLSSVQCCVFCKSHRDELEHIVRCPFACELGARHLGLVFDTSSIEEALLFRYNSISNLTARALHLFAIFGCRFSDCSDFERVYVEKCRKAFSLHPKLGQAVTLL